MKKLTKKEEEIMNLFWDKGAMFVRELLEHYDEPKPHFNNSYLSAVSTLVKEEKITVEELKDLIEQIENGNS